MITFWIISLLIIIPALWATGKAITEQRTTDAMLQFSTLLCLLIHFSMFWWQFYLGMEPAPMHSYACCLASVMILPLIYIYSSRRIGACHTNDVLIMFGLALVGLTMRGVVNYGMGESPDIKPDLMHVAFCVNDAYIILKAQNIAIVLQCFYGIYKILIVVYKLRNRNYRYSKNFLYFTHVAVAGIILSIISFIPDNELWRHALPSYAFCILMLAIIGTGYTFLALRMDENPLVDEQGDPIVLASHERFLELKVKFLKLMNEEKAFLEEDISMDSVARRLGTNRTYLSQMIKEQLNSTFSTFVTEQRVAAAKEMLTSENNEMKLQEVAWKSGFASVSTFNKVFKQNTGMSPGAWRTAISAKE